MGLVSRALQVESRVIKVYNFEHGHILGEALVGIELRLKAVSRAVRVQHQVVSAAHDHGLIARFQRLFRQVTRLVIEQPVAVTTPGDAFHKHTRTALMG